MLRRLPAALVALALVATAGLAGCGDDGDDGGDEAATGGTAVDEAAELPAPLAAFLDRVAPAGEVAFTATYDVLARLGGTRTEVTVEAEPPGWTITAGDVAVTGGPSARTCRAGECEPGVQEQVLVPVGVFSRFFAGGQADVLATAARRRGADAPVFTSRTLAGVEVDCVAIPLDGTVVAAGCLTPEGVFAFADGPAARFELTSYRPGA